MAEMKIFNRFQNSFVGREILSSCATTSFDLEWYGNPPEKESLHFVPLKVLSTQLEINPLPQKKPMSFAISFLVTQSHRIKEFSFFKGYIERHL
jgi:hypothetical protein